MPKSQARRTRPALSILASVLLLAVAGPAAPKAVQAQDVELLGQIHETRPPDGYYRQLRRDPDSFQFGSEGRERLDRLRTGMRAGRAGVVLNPDAPALVLGPREEPVVGAFGLPMVLGLYSDASQHAVQYKVAALLLAGRIQAQGGGLDAAQAHYEHALQLARSSMGRAEATLGLARVHAARGEVEKASRDYTRLRTSWPSTAAGLLGSLEEYRLLKRHGMDLEATAVLSQAMDHYRTVIAGFGTELPALRAAGYLSEVLGRSGSWEQGVTFLDSIAATFSEDPRAGSLLLRAARIAADELEDPVRAQGLLRRVSQRYPDSDLAIAIRPFADSLRATLEVR